MTHCPSQHDFEQGSDAVLVHYVQTERTAWRFAAGVLLARHREALLRRCWTRMGNQLDAEDALQETLFRAFRALSGFKGEAEFKTWLFAIAENQCNTLISRRIRHQMTDQLRAQIEIHESARARTFDAGRELSPGVKRALSKVSDRDRIILTLRFYGELGIEEIARTLGLKLSATKMRLYRALERFETSYRQLQSIDPS